MHLMHLSSSSKFIITTEKDAVRLREFTDMEEPIKSALFYIPVGITFLNDDKEEFDNLIVDYVRKNKKISGFLKDKGFINPVAGIILGTGLGGLSAGIENRIEIDYKDIPDFPLSTVDGHDGKLIYGVLGGKKVVAMKGRFHYYEGYGPEMVALPVRVLKYLGISTLFLSNAAGGVNPAFRIGDIMVITDHINLLPNPLIGKNDDRIGVRFPDMGEAYDKALIDQAFIIARKNNIILQKGIYLATTGPTYETPAEYRYFRIIRS